MGFLSFPYVASGVAATTAVSFAWLSRQPASRKSGPLEIIVGREKNNAVNSMSSRIMDACTLLNSEYITPFFLKNEHVETILGAKLRHNPHVDYFRQCVTTDDGGVFTMDWDTKGTAELKDDSNVVILLPGLTGGSGCNYVRHFVIRARKRGFRVVVFNSRGCAESPVITPQFYSARFTSDMKQVVEEVKKSHPESRIFCVGWSLGANILINYLSDFAEDSIQNITGAAALANPFDLLVSNANITKGFNNLYNYSLGNALSKIYKRHRALFLHPSVMRTLRIDIADKGKTIREFDEAITRRSFGYNSVDEYYKDASSAQRVKDVKIPLFVVNALDDPIAPASAIPRDALAENPNCLTAITPGGGHLGWSGGPEGWRGVPWTHDVVLEFIHATEQLTGEIGIPETQMEQLKEISPAILQQAN